MSGHPKSTIDVCGELLRSLAESHRLAELIRGDQDRADAISAVMRSIGEHLHATGGTVAMDAAFAIAEEGDTFGRLTGCINVAWDGIGNWVA